MTPDDLARLKALAEAATPGKRVAVVRTGRNPPPPPADMVLIAAVAPGHLAMNTPLARLYIVTRSPADGAPVYHDLPAAARFADVTTDLDAFEDQVPPEAEPDEDDEPVWRWALAVIAAGCAVVFVVVPLVRWWW